MTFERSSGLLLHPTSLPGPYGIGEVGPAAFEFVDWLARAGCRLWQVLPLGPTGYGDSPYQSFSAFAGNPILVSPEFLLRDDLLHPDDLLREPDFPAERVDYGRIIPWKLNLLERAFIRFRSRSGAVRGDYERFCDRNRSWLTEYALFMALKETNGGRAWGDWPEPLRLREEDALREAGDRHAEAVERYQFYQFAFYRQWGALRKYAREKGIRIIGDIPIFVAHDSADVWAHTDLFRLDESGQPTVVSGVPPDYFSETGQLWGNPLYRWEVLQDTGYEWWIARLRRTFEQVDIVRLDHFRGFAGYWEIPAGSPTAETGRWVPAPGEDFFKKVKSALGGLPIIAEDLGVITPDVVALREQFGLPGMKILQFGFTGPGDPFLPHNYPAHCVVYTGTHDNDTARGWLASAPKNERDFALRYLSTDERSFAWDLVRAAWSSVAVYAIAPVQDLLGLGTEARMNYPSTLGGNWSWRLKSDALTDTLGDRMRELNYLYQR